MSANRRFDALERERADRRPRRESRPDGRFGMALDLDRKVEDGHQAIAHLLVDDAVMRPDALRALIMERADGVAQLDRVHLMGKLGISADISEQDGGGGGDVPAL